MNMYGFNDNIKHFMELSNCKIEVSIINMHVQGFFTIHEPHNKNRLDCLADIEQYRSIPLAKIVLIKSMLFIFFIIFKTKVDTLTDSSCKSAKIHKNPNSFVF